MKRLIAIFLIATAGLSLCSCGAPKEKKADKITISHCQGEWCWPILNEIADAYTEKTGIDVEFNFVASDSYQQWQASQFAAGNEPDIVWGMNEAKTYYNNGKIMSLTKYYNEQSPFSGNVWKDDYLDGILDGCYDETGKEYISNVILRSQVNLYYNKKIFKDLNLEAPKNWSDVLTISKKIKDAGIIPISIMNSTPWNLDWLVENIVEDCYSKTGKVDKLDVINENEKLDKTEAILGLKTGVLKFNDPAFVSYFKLMKELVPYFNTGFNSASWEYESLFEDGKSAMTFNGSWYPNQHLVNESTVDYGIAMIPYVDSAISSEARNEEVKYITSSSDGDIVVTKKAEKEGRGQAAVEFLQFLSDAKGAGKTWVSKTMFLPVIKDVELPEVMKPFEDFVGTTPLVYSARQIFNVDTEAYTQYNELFCKYLESNQAPEAFADEIQKLYKKYIDDAMSLSSIDIKSYINKVK